MSEPSSTDPEEDLDDDGLGDEAVISEDDVEAFTDDDEWREMFRGDPPGVMAEVDARIEETAKAYGEAISSVLLRKHKGPGPHPGTGTPQTVHGGIGASEAEALVDLLERQGGFTWDGKMHLIVLSGKVVSPFKQDEEKIPIADFRRHSKQELMGYVKRHLARLKGGAKLGGWVSEGQVWLDAVIVTKSRIEAAGVAVRASRDAYYDLDEQRTYWRTPAGSYEVREEAT